MVVLSISTDRPERLHSRATSGNSLSGDSIAGIHRFNLIPIARPLSRKVTIKARRAHVRFNGSDATDRDRQDKLTKLEDKIRYEDPDLELGKTLEAPSPLPHKSRAHPSHASTLRCLTAKSSGAGS
jgi:hypothetical protein